MNAVKDKLIALVGEELEAANAIYPPFSSMHEGYAVMLEEVEEVENELEVLKNGLKNLWSFTKWDDVALGCESAEGAERRAVNLAAEAIQVAAMARKFQAIGKGMSAPGMEVE